MFTIVEKQTLAPTVHRMVIRAPEIARKHRAGNFVILRVHEKGERIPLTVADKDPEAGTITLVFQAVGKTTSELGGLQAGDALLDLAGPMGKPTHIETFDGVTVCVGGGIGVAPVHPIACALKEAGNRVVSIIGARTKELLIMEDEMRRASDELLVATDDGSYGHHGFVTDVLKQVIEREGKENVALVVAIGPVPMMRACCRVTEPYGVHTVVSLNPIMVDATGMCGACRVTVGGETKFACVDGPEFDGHKVDFDELAKRLRMYVEDERRAMQIWSEQHAGHQCHG
ncbi:MAG: sulfide/dihydroorotate dehydrogenase-like FAD/NAD-binding protein [Candidatus Dadabacteria bacterium]|nr:MAG: sulfide/dihydroorotate dehydrogenase-like FAD/NAD-binding protein [Candidatus Dadabacteria bacterium]